MDSSTLQHYITLALERAGVSICGDMRGEIRDILLPVEREFSQMEKRLAALEDRFRQLEGGAE
jgi:hypothetical protein